MNACNYLYNVSSLELFIENWETKIKELGDYAFLVESGADYWIKFGRYPHKYLFYFDSVRFWPTLTDIFRLDRNKIKMKLIWCPIKEG